MLVELVGHTRTVGRYRLEREIARGRMGVVYAAYDEHLDRWVALKLLLGEFADDRDFRARFIHESRAALALDHPHILPVFDTGEANGILYIATRLVEGVDLRHHLARSRTLSVERALTIGGQIAGALDYSHRRGLIHRDVTPGNILLVAEEHADGDHAYLIDFGITTSQSRDVRLTATGHLVGTPEYISPEQIGQRPVDGRADQYALACVLYECLAGASPFRRPTTVDVLHAHLHEDPPSPSTIVGALPRSVDAAIVRALSRDPEQRFPNCRAFIAAARGLEAETGSRVVPEIAPARPPRSRSVIAFAVAFGVLVAAAGALAATTLSDGDPKDAGNGNPGVGTSSTPTRTVAPPRTAPPATLHPIDVRGMAMRLVNLRGYSVKLPATWDLTARDELQAARPIGVSRRRTVTSSRALDVTLLIDALANFDPTPAENGKALHRAYEHDPDKPGYRRTSNPQYLIGGDLAYQMNYRFEGPSGKTVYNVDVILKRGRRQFAVLAYGQATSADLAALARATAASIVITPKPSSPPPPQPPPLPPPPPPPSPRADGKKRPASGTYIGIGRKYDDDNDVVDTDTVSIKFTKHDGVSINYPKLGCQGRLYQVAIDGSRRVFSEEIEKGECNSGRRWRIERLSKDTINVTRTRTGDPVPMTGILKRRAAPPKPTSSSRRPPTV